MSRKRLLSRSCSDDEGYENQRQNELNDHNLNLKNQKNVKESEQNKNQSSKQICINDQDSYEKKGITIEKNEYGNESESKIQKIEAKQLQKQYQQQQLIIENISQGNQVKPQIKQVEIKEQQEKENAEQEECDSFSDENEGTLEYANQLHSFSSDPSQKHRQYLLKKTQRYYEKDDQIFSELLKQNRNYKQSENSGDIEDEDQSEEEDEEDDSSITQLSERVISNNQKILRQMEQFLKDRRAEIIKAPSETQSKITSFSLFTLKCSKNHVWDASLKILQNYWCPRCEIPFEKVKQYVKKLEGKVISMCLLDEMEFQCVKKHRFVLKLKTYYENWCQQCFNDIYNSLEMPSDYEQFQKIEVTSHRKAMEFMQKNPNTFNFQKDFEKICSVFYVIEIPEQTYLLYLQSLEKEDLKKHKGKILKNIHPDVNKHPMARNAFTKFSSIISKL